MLPDTVGASKKSIIERSCEKWSQYLSPSGTRSPIRRGRKRPRHHILVAVGNEDYGVQNHVTKILYVLVCTYVHLYAKNLRYLPDCFSSPECNCAEVMFPLGLLLVSIGPNWKESILRFNSCMRRTPVSMNCFKRCFMQSGKTPSSKSCITSGARPSVTWKYWSSFRTASRAKP